jgi:type IV pilus assembly protein PilE
MVALQHRKSLPMFLVKPDKIIFAKKGKNHSNGSLAGWTLIELILIVLIVIILSSVALVKYGPISEKAYSAEAYSVLAQIASAENVYKLENTSYTSNMDNLDIDDPNDTSQNFTYTVPVTGAGAYALATPKTGSSAKNTYCMCLQGGLQSTTCPPSCP